jgi:hypothetical protein
MKKRDKNPNAVALGKLGGLATQAALSSKERRELGQTGNRARNKSLSPERRREIARLAVAARERKRAGGSRHV